MDKTNYPLLSIVAIVAIAAIVALFLSARADQGIASPVEAVSGLFSLEITGHVTAGAPQAAPRQHNRLDLDNNGKLDIDDATLLGNVIDRAEFCPRNKRCDVNNDGQIDMQDLGMLNSEIIKQQPSRSTPAAPQYVPSPPQKPFADNPALSAAAFGGIA